MLQPHAQRGPFVGENCLHIVAANSKEDELLEMLDLAIARLPGDMVELMLTAQCEGVFFTEVPVLGAGARCPCPSAAAPSPSPSPLP
tara:strand:- start:248 stop:508 length:261 start_codon:yes stop_codon:yes gene_type:complete